MSSGELKHYNIRVVGNVQGVFFRASTVDKAKSLGLHGFVRNESDGSVYIEAEGREADVQQLIDWARSGPPRANVFSCDVAEDELRHYSGFQIQR